MTDGAPVFLFIFSICLWFGFWVRCKCCAHIHNKQQHSELFTVSLCTNRKIINMISIEFMNYGTTGRALGWVSFWSIADGFVFQCAIFGDAIYAYIRGPRTHTHGVCAAEVVSLGSNIFFFYFAIQKNAKPRMAVLNSKLQHILHCYLFIDNLFSYSLLLMTVPRKANSSFRFLSQFYDSKMTKIYFSALYLSFSLSL